MVVLALLWSVVFVSMILFVVNVVCCIYEHDSVGG